MEENTPLLNQIVEETEMHLRSQMKRMLDIKAPSRVLAGTSLQIKIAEEMRETLEKSAQAEDFLAKLMDRFQ